MFKNFLQKNIQIITMLILLISIVFIYKYFGLNLKAANSYSCNYYMGRCFVDNTYGKSNNFDTCNQECFNNKFKYYFNKTANVCTRDFRGNYNTKQECEDQNMKKFQYLCDSQTGRCVPVGGGINYLQMGTDYDTCHKNCRPLHRAYECDQANMKCNFVAKSDDNAKLTYDSCWTYCMGQDINKLPAETLYQCSASGACVPNPSGTFKTYEECYNNTTCKANRIIYQEKISKRYTWDTKQNKCVQKSNGEFENWSECRAVKQGIGSGMVYSCGQMNKCVEKPWSDYIQTVILNGGIMGCSSSDCMTSGGAGGAIVKEVYPEMSCDIYDKCLVDPEASNPEIIYVTKEACYKYCESENAVDPLTGKPMATTSNSGCITNHWLDVGQDFCNDNSECGMVNNVCRNKKNLPNQIYESVTREVCQKNGITFVDFNHTCRCISKVCTEVEKSRATINSQVLSSMVCGDGQCLHIENIPWLYWGMNKDSKGEYKLTSPEWNKYYCSRDCKK